MLFIELKSLYDMMYNNFISIQLFRGGQLWKRLLLWCC